MPPSVDVRTSRTLPVRPVRRVRLAAGVLLVSTALVVTPHLALAAEPAPPAGAPTTAATSDPATGDPAADPATTAPAPTEPAPTDPAPTETTAPAPEPDPAPAPAPSTTATDEPTPTPTATPVTHVAIDVTGETRSGAWASLHQVRDGSPVRVYFAVMDERGAPRAGTVDVQYGQGGVWRSVARVPIKATGGGMVTHLPLRGTRYRIVYAAQGAAPAGGSRGWDVVVNPYLPAVALPSGAPRPSQAAPALVRAPNLASEGAWPQVLQIGNAAWEQMNGISWRSGCPVGRSQLRLVRVNYLGFDGYRYRGEIVVNAAIATRTANAFAALYDKRIPIRSMARVDWFGYSSQLRGGDDYKSMAADNTSGFNCRGVVGRPSTRSPHSTGRSIDINPWENPYRSATGVVPNTWWVSRSHPQVAWRSRSHQVIKIMEYWGFRWTYGTADAHHFDG